MNGSAQPQVPVPGSRRLVMSFGTAHFLYLTVRKRFQKWKGELRPESGKVILTVPNKQTLVEGYRSFRR